MNSLHFRPSLGKTPALLLLLALLFTLGTSANVTYAPAPDINFTKIVDLTKTTPDSFMTGSKRLQGLQIAQGTNTTTFKLIFFNRSMDNYTNQYVIADEPGNWIYLKGTQETLSCSLIYETTNDTFGLLLFQNDLGVFKILSKISLETVRAALPAAYSAANYSSLAGAFSPSENCVAGLLVDKVYFLTSPTEATILGLPTGWNIESYTESFEYGITNSKLYKLNPDTYQYDLIYTFDKFRTFTLKEYSGRMIITGANATNSSSGLYGYSDFLQKIYFFVTTSAGLTLINSITLNGSAYGEKSLSIYCSPQLTKMGYSYIPAGSNGTQQIFAKSIDYMNKQVIDITYSDPVHAFQTFSGSQPSEFDFSDYFLVVRNVSGLFYNSSATAVEEVYQFIGNKIVFFDKRDLTSPLETDPGSFVKMYVDRYYTSSLVLLDIYTKADGSGSDIYEVQYGNYADRTRIVPQAVSPYIKFPLPTKTYEEPMNPTSFTWSYYNVETNGIPNTTINIYRANPNSSETHLDTFTKKIMDYHNLVARSTNCRIFYISDTTPPYFSLLKLDPALSNQTSIYRLKDAIAGLHATSDDTWAVSDDCSRFIVKNTAFYLLSNGSFTPTNNSLGTLNGTYDVTGDSNLRFIVSSGNIWRFDDSQNKYVQLTNDSALYAVSSVYSSENKVLISSFNSTMYVKVNAYVYSSGALVPFFSYSQSFDLEPSVQVSTALDKVVISGGRNSSAGVVGLVEAFLLDYSGMSNKTINFPMTTIRSILFTSISVNADFLYVRQRPDPSQSSNTTYTAVKQQEFVYYLSQGYIPQLLIQRDLTTEQAATWKKSLIATKDSINYYLAAESKETIDNVEYVIVRLTELNPKQAALNSGSNQAVSGYVVNGAIVLCSPGCNDCSTQTCTGCKTGFAFNSNSAICLPCAPGCITCDASDPTKCSSCFNSTYLSGNKCLPCNDTCITCSGSANSCLTCTSGQYFDNTQCQPCPRNCLTCSNGGTCTQCNKGFVVTPAHTCRGCAITCSDCSPSDITTCTACGKGLQLVGAKCIQCPDNCLECNSGSCQTCIPGYSTNSAGTCVPNCRLPCATCVDFQPSTCLSCFNSASVSSGTCVASLSCNSTGSCTDCGQGLNYFLLDQYCYPCSQIATIPNCIQCSQSNQQICSICQDGSYLDSTGICPSCPSSCVTCVGSNLCTACQIGYTLPTDQSQGACLQCQSPCASCSGVAKYCTSCISGYTKEGWKCQNNVRIAFTLTLGGDVAAVLTNIDLIIAALLPMMGQSSSNIEVITIQSITSGSAVIAASASPPSITTAAATFSSNLATTSILGGLSVTSTTVATTGSSSSQEKSNIGLIVGLTVGLVVFTVVLVLVILYVVKAKERLSRETIGDSTMMIGGEVVVHPHVQERFELEKEAVGHSEQEFKA